MTALLFLLCLLAPADPAPLKTKLVQVAPQPAEAATFERSPGETRAVVLIHGLRLRGVLTNHISEADFEGWQQPQSTLVQTLKQDADVFAFAYGQNVALDRIGASAALADGIGRVRQLGYKEIIPSVTARAESSSGSLWKITPRPV
jgi:hypothetical protein